MTPLAIRIYIGVDVFLFTLFLILAYVAYEINFYCSGTPGVEQYNVFTSFMSELGSFNPERNPYGWYLFSMALWSFTILLIGESIYINRKLIQITQAFQQQSKIKAIIIKTLVILALVFNILTAIGVFCIGCITIDNEDVHNTLLSISDFFFAVAQASQCALVVIALGSQSSQRRNIIYSEIKGQQTADIIQNENKKDEKAAYVYSITKWVLLPFIALLTELLLALIFCIPYMFHIENFTREGVWSPYFWEWLTLLTCLAEIECYCLCLSFVKCQRIDFEETVGSQLNNENDK